MDGFRVMPMTKAASEADFICTVTGNTSVVNTETFRTIKKWMYCVQFWTF